MTSTVPYTFAEAQAQGISYKAWVFMVEQEDIERETEEAEAEQIQEQLPRQIFPGEDPNAICPCPACAKFRYSEHEVELARAVLHA